MGLPPMTVLLLAAGVVALATLQASAQGPNPCHSRIFQQGQGVTCNTVRLPKNLCSKCKLDLDNVQPDGNFASCKNIYKLTTNKCENKIGKYVEANRHCDPVRANLYDLAYNQNNTVLRDQALEDLDYWVYSVCEQCCDCIGMGAQPEDVGALVLERGNCPAHAAFDLCTVYPKLGTFIRSSNPPVGPDPAFPEMCQGDEIDDFLGWLGSPLANGWPSAATVEFGPKIRATLESHMDAAKCSKRKIWERCYALESAQGRV